jgi:cardiolipin synthase (CMP-forming)
MAATTETDPVADRGIWTVPNALSLLRLLGVPLFLWLALGPHADGWAVIVLMVAGATDYLDGKIARRYNQYSRIGSVLDPAADRLYILAAIIALTARDIVPWWLAVALVARDLALATVSRPIGWGFTVWGAALYWVAGYLYVAQFRQVVAVARIDREGAAA